MTMETRIRTVRKSAVERRDEILEAAVAEFAVRGLHGTSTERIAQRAGVSQPYLFRLFGTKKGLFLAAIARGFDRIEQAFRIAAEAEPDLPLAAMGTAYKRLLDQREDLLVQMQAYAACADMDVRDLVRQRFMNLYQYVVDVSGDMDAVQQFFATGMFMNVVATMDMPSLLQEEWKQKMFCHG